MRMTTARRKPIACWPKIDVENTSQGDVRKDRQWTMDGKAGAKEIGVALKIGGESLS
jgi:hypothetical protein